MKDFIINSMRQCTSRYQIIDILMTCATRKDITNTDFTIIYGEALDLLKGV